MVGCTSHFDTLLKKFLMYLGEIQVVYRQSRRTNEEKLIKYFIPSSGAVLLGPSEEERN